MFTTCRALISYSNMYFILTVLKLVVLPSDGSTSTSTYWSLKMQKLYKTIHAISKRKLLRLLVLDLLKIFGGLLLGILRFSANIVIYFVLNNILTQKACRNRYQLFSVR